MSVQTDKGVADLDSNAIAWLENYKNALAKIKEWQEVADVARSHIEKSLGESEVGMYENRPVVRWSFVETHRFDIKRAKELLPEPLLDSLQIVSTSRRFTLVGSENE